MEEIIVEAEVIEPSSELVVTYTPAVFADNLAALDAYVEEQIAPYMGAEINIHDNDMVKEARKCLARRGGNRCDRILNKPVSIRA